jgi:geranylgeranyl pyrophosphate synthase
MDDVLDVTSSTASLGKVAGRDAALGKSTYPALLGVEGATARAESLVSTACEKLRKNGLLSADLAQLAAFVVSRNN